MSSLNPILACQPKRRSPNPSSAKGAVGKIHPYRHSKLSRAIQNEVDIDWVVDVTILQKEDGAKRLRPRCP